MSCWAAAWWRSCTASARRSPEAGRTRWSSACSRAACPRGRLRVVADQGVRAAAALHIIKDRDARGCYLTMMLAVMGMFGMFLFLTYYLQTVLDYTPVQTGLAFLPLTASILIGSTQIAARLLQHVPPRLLLAPGMLLAASGMLFLTQITVHSAYATDILPALIPMGLGMGLTFTPVFSTATAGVAPHDSGVTSPPASTPHSRWAVPSGRPCSTPSPPPAARPTSPRTSPAPPDAPR
ncbi:MFS transporter [Streptomyces sp. F001]|uniref:MFS transporter n=1 Tax=Streptomyces sp. F001 TaxID=1510026 RepID=UPI001F0D4AAC|nr:MFS transporter [Streptomyces sp. F001]